MSEIRRIQAEIKWAQIESAISRAGGWVGDTHTQIRLYSPAALRHTCNGDFVSKMKEILLHGWSLNTEPAEGRGAALYLCLHSFSTAEFWCQGVWGLLPHARTSHQPIWPQHYERCEQASDWQQNLKSWGRSHDGDKEKSCSPAEPAGLSWSQSVTHGQQICRGKLPGVVLVC